MTAQPASAAIIVHNIGHHDVYVELAHEQHRGTLRRVSGHGQASFARDVLAGLDAGMSLRAAGGVADPIVIEPPVPLDWKPGRIRERLLDAKGEGPVSPAVAVRALHLPLVHAAVDAVIRAHAHHATPVHLVLVSSGPADEGTSVAQSTWHTARLLARAVQARWPAVRVHHADRETDQPFTFDHSEVVMRRIDELLAGIRRRVVEVHGEDWVRHVQVYLSANTGTVAAISAMLEGLRDHRPALVHIPSAYAWPADEAGRPALPQVELLDNDRLTQRPARPASDLVDPVQRFAVEQMRAWRADFVAARPVRAAEAKGAEQAEYAFWFRKGRKEVLALLVIRGAAGTLEAHRAVNIEVSLPTGTLCAERNAIGSAFAAHPGLQREGILAVAVLSLDAGLGARLGPCGACSEWLRKVAEVNPDFRVLTFADVGCEQVFVDPIR